MVSRIEITERIVDLITALDFDMKAVRNEAFESVPKFKLRNDRPLLFNFMEYPADDHAQIQRLEDEMVLAHRFHAEDEMGVTISDADPASTAEPVPTKKKKGPVPKPVNAEYLKAREEWKEAVIKARAFKTECDEYVAMLKKRMQGLR